MCKLKPKAESAEVYAPADEAKSLVLITGRHDLGSASEEMIDAADALYDARSDLAYDRQTAKEQHDYDCDEREEERKREHKEDHREEHKEAFKEEHGEAFEKALEAAFEEEYAYEEEHEDEYEEDPEIMRQGCIAIAEATARVIICAAENVSRVMTSGSVPENTVGSYETIDELTTIDEDSHLMQGLSQHELDQAETDFSQLQRLVTTMLAARGHVMGVRSKDALGGGGWFVIRPADVAR